MSYMVPAFLGGELLLSFQFMSLIPFCQVAYRSSLSMVLGSKKTESNGIFNIGYQVLQLFRIRSDAPDSQFFSSHSSLSYDLFRWYNFRSLEFDSFLLRKPQSDIGVIPVCQQDS